MKTEKITIYVYDEVGGDAAISVSDGSAIYEKIDKAITNGLNVVLDFQNINLIITAFLNACIGQLYSKYTSDDLNKFLELKNIKEEDKYLFNKAIKIAKEYFSDSEGFDKSVKQALGYE